MSTVTIPVAKAMSIACGVSDVTDTLTEGDTKVYSVLGREYETSLLLVNTNITTAKFVINGEISKSLLNAESDILAGVSLYVTSIDTVNKKVSFCLDAVDRNVNPTITITSPTSTYSGGVVQASSSTQLQASASDPAGQSIARVEFYFVERNKPNTLIGTDYTAPYSTTWYSSNRGTGEYSLLAKAYTADGRTADTGEHRIYVQASTTPDTAPPVISGVSVDVYADGAQIQYTTDEEAYTTIRYGLTSSLGSVSAGGSAISMSGSIGVPSLKPDTTYYYSISSIDKSGNRANTIVSNFRTKPNSQTCTETDGGLNAYIKGTTTVGTVQATDTCNTKVFNGRDYQYNLVESCSGSDCYVNEAYCNQNSFYNSVKGIGFDLFGCPDGCNNGVCNVRVNTIPKTCIADGNLDDTLGKTSCCSGQAVEGSTLCGNSADWFGSWESCTQICGATGVAAAKCPYGATGTPWCPCPEGTRNNGRYGVGVCTGTNYTAPSQDGIMSLGSINAPVTIVMYSGHQEKYSRIFMTTTFSELKRNYIDTGVVQFIFKQYPIEVFNPNGEQVSQAVICAAQLGNWYTYQELLFTNDEFDAMALRRYANQVGIPAAKFDDCLATGKTLPIVKEHKKEAESLGIEGSPTFVINGEIGVGAQPYSEYEIAIKKALDAKPTKFSPDKCLIQGGGLSCVEFAINDGRVVVIFENNGGRTIENIAATITSTSSTCKNDEETSQIGSIPDGNRVQISMSCGNARFGDQFTGNLRIEFIPQGSTLRQIVTGTVQMKSSENIGDEVEEYTGVIPIEYVPTAPTTCVGCQSNDLCYDYGIRMKQGSTSMYCDMNGGLEPQKAIGVTCENNFECLSNQCSNGVCVDIQAELAEQRGLIQRILAWFDRW